MTEPTQDMAGWEVDGEEREGPGEPPVGTPATSGRASAT